MRLRRWLRQMTVHLYPKQMYRSNSFAGVEIQPGSVVQWPRLDFRNVPAGRGASIAETPLRANVRVPTARKVSVVNQME